MCPEAQSENSLQYREAKTSSEAAEFAEASQGYEFQAFPE